MENAIIAGTGNSRYLKSVSNFATLYPDYNALVTALVSGSLPIDLYGINESGFTQVGTSLDKANLLDDQVAEAISTALSSYVAAPETPNEALAYLVQIVGQNIQLETQTYSGSGTYGQNTPNSITFTRRPKMVWIWALTNATDVQYPLMTPFVYNPNNLTAKAVIYDDYDETDYINYSWSNNTLSWYSLAGEIAQLNRSQTSYICLAICGASLKILGQPQNVTAPQGSTVYFKVIASGSGLSYRWQYRTGSSGSWSNSPATGNTTNRLTVPATIDRNGYQYRCKVTDDTGTTINSSAATLTIT